MTSTLADRLKTETAHVDIKITKPNGATITFSFEVSDSVLERTYLDELNEIVSHYDPDHFINRGCFWWTPRDNKYAYTFKLNAVPTEPNGHHVHVKITAPTS